MADRPTELNPEQLRREITQMVEAMTHPAFVEALRTVNSTPIEKRLAEGSRLLNPQALREKGVPLPADMRISSRYFEEGLPNPIDFGDGPGGRSNLVNAINTAEPGLLDRLRIEKPDLFSELVALPPTPGFSALGACCCGGGPGVCGG